jgi:ERCC4-type nuclease
MILVDDRQDERKKLYPLLEPHGAKLAHLEYGDISFSGRGPEDAIWSIGIERKTLWDLKASSMSGRLAGHQLPGMRNVYNVAYLLVEGQYVLTSSGFVKMKRGKSLVDVGFTGPWRTQQFLGYLNTIEIMTGVKLRFTRNLRETAMMVMALEHWWNSKTFEDHRSHIAFHDLPVFQEQNLVSRVAKEFSCLGLKRAMAAGKYFKSVKEMINAEEKQWRDIPGIGVGVSKRVVMEIAGDIPEPQEKSTLPQCDEQKQSSSST